MDPLSITAGVIALATASAQIGKAISQLRHFGEVPAKIYALKNEISDLEIVLRQVAQALQQSSLVADDSHEALEDVLNHTRDHLADLTTALDRIAKACTGSKIKVISTSTIWSREKDRFQLLRENIASVKATLSLILGTANSNYLQRIILELRRVTDLTANSGSLVCLPERSLIIDQRQSTNTTQQSHTMSASVCDDNDNFLKHHLQDLSGSCKGKSSSRIEAGASDQTVRVVAVHRQPCRSWCPCTCHKKQKLTFTTPGIIEGVIGRLFIGYSGLPLPKKACDFRGCQDRQHLTTTVEYWFPSWFVSLNLKMHLSCLPRSGPELQLTTTRRVPDSSQSIAFAMQGNIDGLKNLFSQGLAGPRDVSDSRGYTLMRWALYAGMHNYETVQFLIAAGASVDEESYDNVWDFLMRGKCDTIQQTALRCITEGGEGDWIEEQNFPLVHRIVFGLSPKLLATELEENPHAAFAMDTQNRTAFDWATARCQLTDMRLLIKHGADMNNMDSTGRTPILHAVDSHNADVLHLVLEAGGNPNPTYPKGLFRSSPLTAAGFSGKTELLKLLLDFEANPNACNPEGMTALHSVARTHNTECAVLLLEYGADLNIRSNNGRTPFAVVIMHNNHPVLQLFVDRCHEYMTTPIDGLDLLPIIAEHADIETMAILASAHPRRISYDVSNSSVSSSRDLLQKRSDYDEKLATAFDELTAIVSADAEETRSPDSALESGFYLSARSSFHSELAGAFSTLNSVYGATSDSEYDEKDEWEDSREHFQSPTSPTFPIMKYKPQRLVLPVHREHVRSLTATTRGAPYSSTAPSSPLVRQLFRDEDENNQ